MPVKNQNIINDFSKLTNTQKVAVLLISMGVEEASKLLKELRDDEVEKITLEIAHMDNISASVVDDVMKEFHDLLEAKQFILEGGIEYARNILEKSKNKDDVTALLKRLENVTGNDAFGMFQENDVAQIVQFVQNENPQIAAVILAHLKLEKAAEILSHLKEDFQVEVAYRLATMNNVSTEVISEIEEVISEQMSNLYSERDNVNRGTSALADILNEASISTEKTVIDNISKRNKELAEEIKNQMFLFEDIITLDDRHIQLILSSVDKADLVLSLKGADEELSGKFLKNMSSRASEMFKEDMEALGPVHVKQVEEAQQRVIKKIKELESQGQISTRKSSSNEVII